MTLLAEKYLSLLIIFIPFFIILGPAIPDIIISLSAIYALANIFIKRRFNELNDSIIISFLVFWISLNISSIFSENLQMSFSSSFFYIRFIFFFIFVKLFFSQNILKKFDPFLVLTICLSFVIIDTYIQFFFREELFGNKLDNQLAVRLTGPFLHGEQIVGSYLSKFGYISLGYLLGFQLNNKKVHELSFNIFFILIFSIIFLSGERMAFLLFNFGCLIFLFFEKQLIMKFFRLFLLCLVLITTLSLSSQSHVIKRALSTFDILGINLSSSDIEDNNFLDSHYGAHFLTSIEIFKENPIIGVGNKMFREVCSADRYKNINSNLSELRCATHPHNIYFQIISENGILGFITFLVFIFYVIKKAYVLMIFEKSFLSKSLFVSIFLLIWPLQSNGGLYNNRYSSIFFFIISMIYLVRSKKLINN